MRYLIYSFVVLLFTFCDSKPQESSPDIRQDDQEKIQELIPNLYKWVKINDSKTHDFDFIGNDSLYTDIDRKALAIRLTQLKATNFFSEEFLNNYENIGNEMGKQLKNGSVKFYVGELPPFGALAASLWYNAQDDPDLPEIKSEDLKIQGDSATLYWRWKGDTGFKYNIRVKKYDTSWKISYMEGFNFESFFN